MLGDERVGLGPAEDVRVEGAESTADGVLDILRGVLPGSVEGARRVLAALQGGARPDDPDLASLSDVVAAFDAAVRALPGTSPTLADLEAAAKAAAERRRVAVLTTLTGPSRYADLLAEIATSAAEGPTEALLLLCDLLDAAATPHPDEDTLVAQTETTWPTSWHRLLWPISRQTITPQNPPQPSVTPTPAEPTPTEPTTAEPTAAETAPAEPEEPATAEPSPAEPAADETAPAEPEPLAPAEPAPAEPAAEETAPAEPEELAPAEPATAEPTADEQAPAEPEVLAVAESAPAEPEADETAESESRDAAGGEAAPGEPESAAVLAEGDAAAEAEPQAAAEDLGQPSGEDGQPEGADEEAASVAPVEGDVAQGVADAVADAGEDVLSSEPGEPEGGEAEGVARAAGEVVEVDGVEGGVGAGALGGVGEMAGVVVVRGSRALGVEAVAGELEEEGARSGIVVRRVGHRGVGEAVGLVGDGGIVVVDLGDVRTVEKARAGLARAVAAGQDGSGVVVLVPPRHAALWHGLPEGVRRLALRPRDAADVRAEYPVLVERPGADAAVWLTGGWPPLLDALARAVTEGTDELETVCARYVREEPLEFVGAAGLLDDPVITAAWTVLAQQDERGPAPDLVVWLEVAGESDHPALGRTALADAGYASHADLVEALRLLAALRAEDDDPKAVLRCDPFLTAAWTALNTQ
ncbi:hypothetical protein LO762_07040 [Actinocorallia sp. API 0066]|uniref:hypothetical protein n=1 Tax=Actinocorallia sp. API 0066 TaxID=2896846 RepID=UPI001E4A4C2C|nr:hypothetical protein [Actinocorallia sp. API 0066]MCD0448944.1 hypothetical protein [Actinocorallia sp. API 0066]